MTANTKANINVNKTNADRLNTMTASGQKITRPSDDPVVAIRAMRLNTSLSELEQYHGKNIPDADAWFTDTETALVQADEVLTSIREKLNQASSEENVTSNVKDILEELKQLKAQYYSIGNADSAGRTVFTGYRTSEMLTFMEADKINYAITEPVNARDIEDCSYVFGTKDVDKDGNAASTDYKEENIELKSFKRVRLAYDNLLDDQGAGKGDGTVSYKDATGTPKTMTCSFASINDTDIDTVYKTAMSASVPTIIRETGEMIIPDSVYEELKDSTDITVEYAKDTWQKGDLRPEHYFKCWTPKDSADPRTYSSSYVEGIEYNFNRFDSEGNPISGNRPQDVTATASLLGFKEQELTYEIAFNQSIQINTHANDSFSHDIGREIDELVNITKLMADAETKVADIKNAVEKATTDADKAAFSKTLAAAEKERTLLREKMHKMYTSALTSFKEYSDGLNEQVANLGALTSRLEMTKNRVKDQQNNVKKIADENINADLSETAIDYKSAQLALEAAQMAAGKIANQTLLNYI